ncbi:MAG: hypothetical protein ACJAVI_000061 [Candidatus Azotimanducaceae bacterium]|jgi:hypothetical protein
MNPDGKRLGGAGISSNYAVEYQGNSYTTCGEYKLWE